MRDHVIGIDLGGTQIRAALVDGGGAIIARAAEPTAADAGPAVVIGQIAALAAMVGQGVDRARIAGAGVSSPGPLDTVRGIALTIPTIKGFVDFPLRDALAQALKMPVVLENDGIAAAIGEWQRGAGKGFANVVYVTVSTGIGGGIIADNRVLRGRQGMAGHVGHMSFIQGGEMCSCGNRGCFEAYASGPAFTRRAQKAGLGEDAAAVFSAALAGDALAQRLVKQEAEMLGQGFASLMHLYSPDIVVMGGGLSNQFDALHAGIIAAVNIHAMPAFRDTPVVRAALGSNSGLIGAASLAR